MEYLRYPEVVSEDVEWYDGPGGRTPDDSEDGGIVKSVAFQATVDVAPKIDEKEGNSGSGRTRRTPY